MNDKKKIIILSLIVTFLCLVMVLEIGFVIYTKNTAESGKRSSKTDKFANDITVTTTEVTSEITTETTTEVVMEADSKENEKMGDRISESDLKENEAEKEIRKMGNIDERDLFVDYVKEKMIPKYGECIIESNQMTTFDWTPDTMPDGAYFTDWYDESVPFFDVGRFEGVITYDIRDFDGDDKLEMIVLRMVNLSQYGLVGEYKLNYSIYTLKNEKVTRTDTGDFMELAKADGYINSQTVASFDSGIVIKNNCIEGWNMKFFEKVDAEGITHFVLENGQKEWIYVEGTPVEYLSATLMTLKNDKLCFEVQAIAVDPNIDTKINSYHVFKFDENKIDSYEIDDEYEYEYDPKGFWDNYKISVPEEITISYDNANTLRKGGDELLLALELKIDNTYNSQTMRQDIKYTAIIKQNE